ncbi:amidase [Stappia sp. ICDLI1TA098]
MSSEERSLRQIAGDLREGGITAAALHTAAVSAREATEARLNAYKTIDDGLAARQAGVADAAFASGMDLGPLQGIPVSVKDLFGVPGYPVFAGMAQALPAEWQRPGPLVSRMRSQLGVVTGKTHTVECAFGGLGTNAHWGAPVNPWSVDAPRAPGGSSSGAGVSLAQGSALVAFGTDTAGSVRIPASVTGQVGLKTTHGRWSLDGIFPLSPSLDTPGLLCRSVADLAFAFAALDPAFMERNREDIAPVDLATLRIGLPDRPFNEDIDPSVSSVFSRTLAEFSPKCRSAVAVELPGVAEVLDIFAKGGLAAPELRTLLDARFPERIATLDPVVRLRIEGADSMPATEYLRRRAVLAACGRQALSVFDEVDVLVTATVAISPPRLDDLADMDVYRHANMMALRNTAIVNLFGWCALTLPAGLDANGMPVGLQLIAPPMQEERLIAVARAIEAAIGTGSQRLGKPPLRS